MSNHNYRLDEQEITKTNTHLLYITKAKYDHDWHSTEHTHHFTELFYVVHGKGEFQVENTTFPVRENDLVIVNPNVSHAEIGHENEPFEYIALGINGLLFQGENHNSPCSYAIYNFSQSKDELLFYLNAMVREIKQKKDHFESVCQNLFEIFIWNVFRQTKLSFSVAPTRKITKECRFIEQYIDEHFTEDITLQTLSDLTYMNKYYLVHAFKQYKGTSPINYLIEKRVAESKHLLSSTNYPVSKIADQIGFSSQSYFSQIFRKKMGMTPNQYRKAMETSPTTQE